MLRILLVIVVAGSACHALSRGTNAAEEFSSSSGLSTQAPRLDDNSTADSPPADGLTVKQIMRYTMTQHLCKKVIKQAASPEEQQRLVELFEALAKCKPPMGSQESWDEKTGALITAAKEVAAGQPAQKALMKAANCAACHNAHRPK